MNKLPYWSSIVFTIALNNHILSLELDNDIEMNNSPRSCNESISPNSLNYEFKNNNSNTDLSSLSSVISQQERQNFSKSVKSGHHSNLNNDSNEEFKKNIINTLDELVKIIQKQKEILEQIANDRNTWNTFFIPTLSASVAGLFVFGCSVYYNSITPK